MREAQVWAVVLATASWGLLLRGLWFAPVSADPLVDLEGGGSFAAGFSVYLPALALTLGFLVVLVAGARNPRSAAPLVVTVAITAFAAWVLTQGYLLAYKPTLDFHLWLSIALAVTGAGVAAVAVFAAPPAGQVAREDLPRSPSA
jgi:hypothetical protein